MKVAARRQVSQVRAAVAAGASDISRAVAANRFPVSGSPPPLRKGRLQPDASADRGPSHSSVASSIFAAVARRHDRLSIFPPFQAVV